MLYLLNRIEIPADVEHKAAVMIEGSVIDAEAWNFAAIGQQDLLQRLQRVKETGLPGGRDADLLLGNLSRYASGPLLPFGRAQCRVAPSD